MPDYEIVETNNNPIAPTMQNTSLAGLNSNTAVAASREIAEIQGRLIIAQQFKRDEDAAYANIMTACKRIKLAETACYTYPRGNTTVTGPSIRLVEEIIRLWGNVDSGIRIIERRGDTTSCEAYAWDMQTNTRSTKRFDVKHIRDKKGGGVTLTSERDIYELIANQGARRLRSCMSAVIPSYILDEAVSQCNKTLASGHEEPLGDRIKKMVAAFKDFGVTKEMIENRLGHVVGTTSEQEMVTLTGIYRALKDNFGKIEDHFDVPKPESKQSEKAMEALKDAQMKSKSSRKVSNPSDTATNDDEEAVQNSEATPREKLIKQCTDMMLNVPDCQTLGAAFLESKEAKSVNKLNLAQLKELHGVLEPAMRRWETEQSN